MIVEDFKNVCVLAIESQSEDESTRNRSVSPTHADGYMQLFPLYVLPLWEKYRTGGHLVSQTMLSLSEPSVNQALDSRSKRLFWIA